MLSPTLSERVDALIDDLIMDGGVESASLASILLASKDSLEGDYLVTLSRRVWSASNELKAGYAFEQMKHSLPRIEAEPSEGTSSRPLCHSG